MSNRNKHDLDKECPICGGIIWGRGQLTLVEGAKIVVCQSCAQHGKKVFSKPKITYPKRINSYKNSSTPKKTYKTQKKAYQPELVIVDDYSERIRKIRQKNNLTQEKFAQKIHEKESLIKRIETKKTKPSIDLAKKIEKEYNIKLLDESDIIEVNTDKYMKKSTGSSLGDTAFIKKKKKD